MGNEKEDPWIAIWVLFAAIVLLAILVVHGAKQHAELRQRVDALEAQHADVWGNESIQVYR